MPEKRILELLLSKVQIDGGTQTRARTCQETVDDYTEALKANCTFPPIMVFHDGETYWLADGFHRRLAHLQAKRRTILAEIRAGTLRDAILFAVGANSLHGLRRSNDDKRHAVRLLLSDDEWGQWSTKAIADQCGVSQALVRVTRLIFKEKRGLSSRGATIQSSERIERIERRKCERNGTQYTMEPGGKKSPADEEAEAIAREDLQTCLEEGRQLAGGPANAAGVLPHIMAGLEVLAALAETEAA